MTKKMRFPMICLAVGLLFVACGPSEAELAIQATATGVAQSATQTAAAPTATATATPLPTDTPTPTPTNTPIPTATPTPVSGGAILEAAQAAMSEVDSFGLTMDMDIELEMEGLSLAMPATFVGDYAAPDSMQYVMTMTLMGQTIVIQGITIDDTTYVQDPTTGQWEVTTETTSPISPEEVTGLDLEALTDLQYVGEETLDGTPVYHLAASIPAGPLLNDETLSDTEAEFAVDCWIGVDDDLFRQMTMAGEVLTDVEGQPATMVISATITFADYGKPVSISPPVP